MFLRNYWYVAATSAEIGRTPLARLILGEPVVFFRKEDGTPVALEDRCAHRHVPLSMGKLAAEGAAVVLADVLDGAAVAERIVNKQLGSVRERRDPPRFLVGFGQLIFV